MVFIQMVWDPFTEFNDLLSLLGNVCWLFLVTRCWLFLVIPLLIAVEFKLGHHLITPAIAHLWIFVVYQSIHIFHIEITSLKLSKPCLTCFSQWPYLSYVHISNTDYQVFFFWLSKKSNEWQKKIFFQTQNSTWPLNDKLKTLVFVGFNIVYL